MQRSKNDETRHPLPPSRKRANSKNVRSTSSFTHSSKKPSREPASSCLSGLPDKRAWHNRVSESHAIAVIQKLARASAAPKRRGVSNIYGYIAYTAEGAHSTWIYHPREDKLQLDVFLCFTVPVAAGISLFTLKLLRD